MTSDTSPRPVSPLRARMIEDMTVRGFKEDTRRDYVRHVRAFAAFIGRSPDTATAEDLRLFQLHQTQSGMQPPSINSVVSALRFFFTVTLDAEHSGIRRGYGTTVSRRARSGRSSVTVKKKRRAETALLMLGGCMPIRVWCSWNRRRSSAVAVSGERPIKAANARTWRT